MVECFRTNIFLAYLPAHTSHGLQALDNGIFNVLKVAYEKLISQLNSITESAPVSKINFVRCLVEARKAITERTIRGGFSHTGTWPINRQKALSHPEIQPDKKEEPQNVVVVAQNEEIVNRE